jgi:hypothetical protein
MRERRRAASRSSVPEIRFVCIYVPMLLFPKKRPALVDEDGGGGF